MNRLLIALSLAATLSGCTSYSLSNKFDPAQAAFINEEGPATITGQALLRRDNGQLAYAAGSEVVLVPRTPYSDERIARIYGGNKQSVAGATFANDVPEYYQYVRKTVADTQGRFSFPSVAAGSYYVVTDVAWTEGSKREARTVMELVTVPDRRVEQQVVVPSFRNGN